MNIIQAALLGLVQGITEFFPISSSGHLTLVGDFLGAEGSSNLMFMIMLHLGTLFSVLTVFHKDVHRILAEYCGMAGDILFNLKLHFRDPLHRSGVRYRRIVNDSYRKFAAMLLVSMIPTVIVAYLVSPIVEMLTGNLLASGLGLFVTALLLFVSSFMLSNNRGPRESKYLDAFVIGAFQGFAAFPRKFQAGYDSVLRISQRLHQKVRVKIRICPVGSHHHRRHDPGSYQKSCHGCAGRDPALPCRDAGVCFRGIFCDPDRHETAFQKKKPLFCGILPDHRNPFYRKVPCLILYQSEEIFVIC